MIAALADWNMFRPANNQWHSVAPFPDVSFVSAVRPARQVTRRDELDGALERALAHEGPATVEVITDALLV